MTRETGTRTARDAGTETDGGARATGGPVRRLPQPSPRTRRLVLPLLVTVLLAQMAVALVTCAAQETPTIDEPVYVGAATVYVREHSLRYNPEHPPLGKLFIGAGVALARPHLDTSFTGDEGAVGRHLLYESGNDPWRLMLWARLPVIALTLLFGLAVFAFARELAGAVGGLTALALYTFSPDVVAHGSLATLDVPAAGFVLTSVWLLWRARIRPWRYLPLAGAALGAACATRASTLPAVAVLVPLAVLSVRAAYGRHRPPGRPGPEPVPGQLRTPLARAVCAVLVVLVTAVAVVWVSYLAVDPRLRWALPPEVGRPHGLRVRLAGLLPFPRPYRDGMLIQFGLEARPWQTFLFGRVHTGPLWYYLPAAFAVKTPLGTLVLWAAGTGALLAVRGLRPAALYVLLPAVVLTAFVMDSARDFGTRYAVLVPMLLAVAAGCVPVLVRRAFRDTRRRWAFAATGALVAFAAVSSVRAYPYYLPYSNEAFGGPAATHLRLHDSNVDWGQDLGRLADRLRERYPGERVWLVYKGSGVPARYGIRAADPRAVPPDTVHGLLAVSDSAAARATGRLALLLRTSRPVDDVGHSITVYRR
ncbi:glycosyltransferase family 39 protein [Streptomyces sp. NPDC090306]|uniref:glycosyltransferase family 39 protein n=1 Tax=Streptomyces sp. NPDC090306 TaxID=3365961 RepID=UPI00381A7826